MTSYEYARARMTIRAVRLIPSLRLTRRSYPLAALVAARTNTTHYAYVVGVRKTLR